MANNYTQFSEKILLKGSAECAWWKRHIELDSDTPGAWDEEGKPLTKEAKVMYDITDSDPYWGFEAFVKIDQDTTTPYVLITSWECGNVDHVAKLVQLFLREMRPNENFLFTLGWAGICDKLRIGEFGGGAVAVTKDTIKYVSTWEWIDEQAAAFDKEHPCTHTPCAESEPTPPASPSRTKKPRKRG